MKKIFAAAAAFFILTGCGQVGQESSPPQETPPSNLTAETMNCQILYRMEESLLLAKEGDGITGELILFSPAGIDVVDEQGNTAQPSQLEAGMTIQIHYDGSVLESYPCQLSGVTALRITGTFESLLPFYLDRIDELYQEDAGLNEGAEKIALDLTELTNLTEKEKEALCYLVGCRYEKEAFQSTYEKLCEEGQIDREEMYYQDGMILSLSSQERSERSFTFSAMKWRSGLGAIGYRDVKAEQKNGQWKYQIENWFIS
ncbi:MAG: hypothetical protein ACI4I8_02380 [Oscillospiraceae bacterium]